MAIDHKLISSFVSEMQFSYSESESISLEQHFSVYEKFLRQLGYDGATYSFVPKIQIEVMKDLPAIFLSTSAYPIGFIEQYTAERLDQNDFTVRKILAGEMIPMDWREHEINGWVSEIEANVIKLARDKYGIKNAISIPMLYEEKGLAGASVISYLNDDAFNKLKEKTLDSLLSITRLFHVRISSEEDLTYKFILPVLKNLSEKEITILSYKASGKLMVNIEDETGISSSFAANLLSRLRKRLGGINTERLMYLMGLLNTIGTIQR